VRRGSVVVIVIVVIVVIVVIIVIIVIVVVIVIIIVVVIVVIIAIPTIVIPVTIIVITIPTIVIAVTIIVIAAPAIIIPIIIIVIAIPTIVIPVTIIVITIPTIIIPVTIIVIAAPAIAVAVEPILELHVDLETLALPEGRGEGGEVEPRTVDLDDQAGDPEEGGVADGFGAGQLDDDVDEASDAAQQVELEFDLVALDLDLADAHQGVRLIEDGEAELASGGVEDEGGEQGDEQRAQSSGHGVSSFEHHETPGA
jgi:hypothetical protein